MMWGRVIELMTVAYVALSPFFFDAQSQQGAVAVSLAAAAMIGLLSALSYWRPTENAHYWNLLAAGALVAYGRFAESPPPPLHQSHIVVGLYLMMIAVIPNEASQPPRWWRDAERPPGEQ